MTVAALVASIALFVPVPQDVTVVLGDCPAYQAGSASCADPNTRTIYLEADLRWNDRSVVRDVLAHELGHFFDHDTLSDGDRQALQSLWGVGGEWWGGGDLSDWTRDHPPPAERFADAYALCAKKPSRRYWWHDHIYGPTAYRDRFSHRQLAVTCWLVHDRGQHEALAR